MRARVVGALLVGVLVAGCSGGEDVDVDLPAAGSDASCDPGDDVSVVMDPAAPVLLGGEIIDLAPGSSTSGDRTLELAFADNAPVEVVGATGPVDDDLRNAIASAVRDSAEDSTERFFSLEPLPPTLDVAVDLTNATGEQLVWGTYVVTSRRSGAWTAEGCPDASQRGEVRGWDGQLRSGTLACFSASSPSRAPRTDQAVERLVTAELCRD